MKLPTGRALAVLTLLPLPSLAHIEMTQPYAIRSKYNPANVAAGDVDYSMTDPLSASGSDFACKGYQNDRPIHTVADYALGSQQILSLAGSATHGGGSCQVSLSYDNGRTFRVVKSMIGGCPLAKQYNFTVPAYAPGGTALLAWSWQNLVGNREYYMNCAWVNVVVGGSGSGSDATKPPGHRRRHPALRRRAAQAFSSFDDLPFLWKANIPPINDCVTVEGVTPVYPHPGPDVEYGGGPRGGERPNQPPATTTHAAPPPPGRAGVAGGGGLRPPPPKPGDLRQSDP